MSQLANQCVYSQIQSYSIQNQRLRPFASQVGVFIATRGFDVALTSAAAIGAAAAATHAASVPLTPAILQAAAVGGAVKAGAMAFAGILSFANLSGPLVVLPVLLATSFVTNILVILAVTSRVLGHVPNELIIASVVASLPLSFCIIYYYGALHVPVTFTSIVFDVLGAYAFVAMADHLSYTVCMAKVAMIAGAAFAAISSGTTTLLGCCIIGRSRTLSVSNGSSDGSTQGTTHVGWCGNRVHVNLTTTEYYCGFNRSGSSTKTENGMVYNSFHGIGAFWNAGAVNGYIGYFTGRSNSSVTSNTFGSSTGVW